MSGSIRRSLEGAGCAGAIGPPCVCKTGALGAGPGRVVLVVDSTVLGTVFVAVDGSVVVERLIVDTVVDVVLGTAGCVLVVEGGAVVVVGSSVVDVLVVAIEVPGGC